MGQLNKTLQVFVLDESHVIASFALILLPSFLTCDMYAVVMLKLLLHNYIFKSIILFCIANFLLIVYKKMYPLFC